MDFIFLKTLKTRGDPAFNINRNPPLIYHLAVNECVDTLLNYKDFWYNFLAKFQSKYTQKIDVLICWHNA